MRMIDADELIRNLESIISDYTSNGIYPEKFGIDDFIDVVKEIPTLPAPQWISVEDRLPHNADEVLIYFSDGIVISGDYFDAVGFIPEHFYDGNGKISHWMPKLEPSDKRYKCRYADDNGVCDKFTESEEIVYCTGRPCLYYTPVEVRDDGAHIEP